MVSPIPWTVWNPAADLLERIIAIIEDAFKKILPDGSYLKNNGKALPSSFSVHVWGGSRSSITVEVRISDVGRSCTVRGDDTDDLVDLVRQATERVAVY